MKYAKPASPDPRALRQQAEQKFREHHPPAEQPPSEIDARALVHELEVHQIELEMQNEELRRAQVELDTARARYFDLYDLAPVGYCTLSEQGLILEANLTAATLLGVARGALVKQPLSRFILPEDQDLYYLHNKRLSEAGEPQTFELRLVRKDEAAFWAHLEAASTQDAAGAPVCRLVLSDITQRKQIEDVQTFLANTSRGTTDEPFFKALARYLAKSLGMNFICIDRLEGNALTARTLAVWHDVKFEDNVAYALKGTPCGAVIDKGICCFPDNVCQLFPDDQVLRDLRAQSYVGVTLWSRAGQQIGLIATIGRRPLTNRSQAEAILKLVAVPAAAELERLDAEATLRQRTIELRERVKELECLYEMSKLVAESDKSIEEIFTEAVCLIPPGWYYPEVTCARIAVGEQQFMTGNFRQTPWKLSADLVASGKKLGSVEVFYLEERPALDEGPFLKEERALIDNLARKISATVERAQAKLALHKSEEKFRALFENAKDGILLLSSRGEVVSSNTAFAAMHGYTLEETLTLNLKDLDAPESAPLAPARLQRLLAGEPTSFEVEHFCKSGQTIPLEVSANLVVIGGEKYILGFHRDITERKRAAEALRESNEKIATILASISDAFFSMNEQLVVTYWNDAAERVLHRPRQEVLGRNLLDAFPEARGSIFETRYRQAVRDKQPVAFEAYFAPAPYRNWYDVRVYPQREGISVFFQCTTERKRIEEALQQTANELERSNADLQQFAYVASHDLQEPLRAVGGYVRLLQLRLLDKLDAKALEYITGAVDGAARMEKLISDLLAFSRIGTQGGDFSPADLNTLLSDALNNLQVSIKAAHAKVTTDRLPTIPVHASQVTRLLQNLIGNAIKFRRERPPEIHIGARQEPGQWVFSVRDNGIGIKPEYFERIFQIFQRLHTRDKYPGTGIGLAVCKKIVERHGGTIWVDSHPAEGSTFHFSFPTSVAP